MKLFSFAIKTNILGRERDVYLDTPHGLLSSLTIKGLDPHEAIKILAVLGDAKCILCGELVCDGPALDGGNVVLQRQNGPQTNDPPAPDFQRPKVGDVLKEEGGVRLVLSGLGQEAPKMPQIAPLPPQPSAPSPQPLPSPKITPLASSKETPASKPERTRKKGSDEGGEPPPLSPALQELGTKHKSTSAAVDAILGSETKEKRTADKISEKIAKATEEEEPEEEEPLVYATAAGLDPDDCDTFTYVNEKTLKTRDVLFPRDASVPTNFHTATNLQQEEQFFVALTPRSFAYFMAVHRSVTSQFERKPGKKNAVFDSNGETPVKIENFEAVIKNGEELRTIATDIFGPDVLQQAELAHAKDPKSYQHKTIFEPLKTPLPSPAPKPEAPAGQGALSLAAPLPKEDEAKKHPASLQSIEAPQASDPQSGGVILVIEKIEYKLDPGVWKAPNLRALVAFLYDAKIPNVQTALRACAILRDDFKKDGASLCPILEVTKATIADRLPALWESHAKEED